MRANKVCPKLKARADLKVRKQDTHLELIIREKKTSTTFGHKNKLQLRFSKRANGISGFFKDEILLKLCLAV